MPSRLEQGSAGATVLIFRSRLPAKQNVPDPRSKRDRQAAGQTGLETANRPAVVMGEIAWALAIPIGTMLLLRILFALLHAW